MRLYFGLVAVVVLGAAGCGQTTAENTSAPASASETVSGIPNAAETPADGSTADSQPIPDNGSAVAAAPAASDLGPSAEGSASPPALKGTPVPIASGTAKLSPENTQVRFVCIHLPPKEPAPRTGTFEKFSGQATVADGTLKSLQIEFDTTSIWTDAGQRLADHLKSPDFFEVREYPTAIFESAQIEATDPAAGKYQITGNLTLHGETKEISFPATVQISDEGLTLQSQFSIQRSDFGMTYGPDAVDDEVKLSAIVGQPNKPE